MWRLGHGQRLFAQQQVGSGEAEVLHPSAEASRGWNEARFGETREGQGDVKACLGTVKQRLVVKRKTDDP